jgi:hypothetical protein
MFIRECAECGETFDTRSPEKRRAGGKVIHCAECSEETATKVLGLTSGDGKQAAISIVQCNSDEDRTKLIRYWHRVGGMHKGKSCQMHTPGTTSPHIGFTIVRSDTSRNHKGKN